MLDRPRMALLAGLGALMGLALALASPAQADATRSTSCVASRGSISCVTTRRSGTGSPYITQVPVPLSDQESNELQQRDKQWQARCKPVVRQDDHGVARYVYAARGCEFGKLD